jgi:DNA-binding transcriptional LysR family regulator
MVIENTLSGFLSHYQFRYPGVEVHFVEDGGLRLPSRLEKGDVHLALIVPDDRFRNKLLYPVLNLAVLSKKHRLSHRRTLDVAALGDEPLLLLQRGFGSREWFDGASNIAHIRPRMRLESAAPHTLIALTQVGYGVAVVPSTVVIPSAVCALPLVQRGVPLGRWLTVAWVPQRLLASYAEQFVDELVAYCRRDFPGRDLVRRAPPLPRSKNVTN